MQSKLSFPQDLPGEPAESPSKLPRWTFPLFVVAMTLSISSFFLKAYFVSEPFGHRMISVIESPDDFHNVTWDDLVVIPAMSRWSYGSFFSDPWNSFNPDYKGWGLGSLFALLGAFLIKIFGDYFIAMFIWGLFNFSLMIIIIYNIFRARPFEFSQAVSIIGVFLLLNLLWLGGQEFERLDKAVPRAFLAGYHFSLVELECGLFTYLPYFLFLFTYWRFIAAQDWKNSVWVGGAAGLLTYVYFFHYAFAFAMIVGHLALSIASKRKREALYLVAALGVGIVLAIPALINNFVFITSTASNHFIERIDYSPGRSPFQDYHWLLRFQIPFVIGVAYFVLRKPSDIKSVMIRTWSVLAIAYAIVLHLRVLVGSMQAVDHYWRVSLGIPASLWCLFAVFDLARSRLAQFKFFRQAIFFSATLLPILILLRFTVEINDVFFNSDNKSQLTEAQLETLEKINCMENVLKPGEGFVAVDPVLNYHTMVNLKGRPFMAMGISPVNIDELSERYLLSAYLAGQDNISYQPSGNRESADYTYEKDLHVYLYVNLFYYPWSNFSLEEGIKMRYQEWNPRDLDLTAWSDALSTVKLVYVANENFKKSLERLKRLFVVEKVIACQDGKALRVDFKAGAGHKEKLIDGVTTLE